MAAPHAFRHLLGRMMIEDTIDQAGAGVSESAPAPAPAPAPQPAPMFNAGGWRGNASYESAAIFFDMAGNIIPDAYAISGGGFYSPSRDTTFQTVAWMGDVGDDTQPNYRAFPWLRNALEIYGPNIQIGAADADVNYSEIQYGPSAPWVAAPAPALAPAPASGGIPWVAIPGYGIPPAVTESWGLPSYVDTTSSPPAAPGVVAVVNPDTGQVQYTAPPAASPGSGLPVVVAPPAPGAVVTAGGGAAPDGTPSVTGTPAAPGANPAAPDKSRALLLAALAALAFLN